MKNPGDTKTTKCLSGILRCLLCTGSLPTYPSDLLIESNTKKIDQKQENTLKVDVEVKESPSTINPGVVARLMGLDSFPNTPLPPRDRTLGSYLRSRSVNSIDFLTHFDPIKQRNHRHRRVKTSVSFHDNFGLELEEIDESEELLIKKIPFQQLDKKERIRNEKNENLIERNVNNKPCKVYARIQENGFDGNLKERRQIIKSVGCKEALIGSSKCVREKVHLGKIQEAPCAKHSRKPSPSIIVDSQCPHSSAYAHWNTGEVRTIIKEKGERKVNNEESLYYKIMVGQIYNLTKENMKENWKLQDIEEISQELGQEIFEDLLEQFIDELVLFYGTKKQFITF